MQAAGRPYPGFDVKVADEAGNPLPPGEVGEVWLRTPAAMVEYWNLPGRHGENAGRRLGGHGRRGLCSTRTATCSSATASRT